MEILARRGDQASVQRNLQRVLATSRSSLACASSGRTRFLRDSHSVLRSLRHLVLGILTAIEGESAVCPDVEALCVFVPDEPLLAHVRDLVLRRAGAGRTLKHLHLVLDVGKETAARISNCTEESGEESREGSNTAPEKPMTCGR